MEFYEESPEFFFQLDQVDKIRKELLAEVYDPKICGKRTEVDYIVHLNTSVKSHRKTLVYQSKTPARREERIIPFLNPKPSQPSLLKRMSISSSLFQFPVMTTHSLQKVSIAYKKMKKEKSTNQALEEPKLKHKNSEEKKSESHLQHMKTALGSIRKFSLELKSLRNPRHLRATTHPLPTKPLAVIHEPPPPFTSLPKLTKKKSRDQKGGKDPGEVQQNKQEKEYQDSLKARPKKSMLGFMSHLNKKPSTQKQDPEPLADTAPPKPKEEKKLTVYEILQQYSNRTISTSTTTTCSSECSPSHHNLSPTELPKYASCSKLSKLKSINSPPGHAMEGALANIKLLSKLNTLNVLQTYVEDDLASHNQQQRRKTANSGKSQDTLKLSLHPCPPKHIHTQTSPNVHHHHAHPHSAKARRFTTPDNEDTFANNMAKLSFGLNTLPY
jgi:hypothetical protein